MDWLSTVILAIAFPLSFLAWRRTVQKRRLMTFVFLVLPVFFFSLRWAAYRQNWLEWGIGLSAATLIALLWWTLLGRKLPATHDGTQRVWTKDDPFE